MAMLRCPHCGGPGISTWRKIYLGPTFPANCRTCGRKIGVPYVRSLLGLLPILVASVAIVSVDAWSIRVLCVVVGAAGALYVFLRYVPLIQR